MACSLVVVIVVIVVFIDVVVVVVVFALVGGFIVVPLGLGVIDVFGVGVLARALFSSIVEVSLSLVLLHYPRACLGNRSLDVFCVLVLLALRLPCDCVACLCVRI